MPDRNCSLTRHPWMRLTLAVMSAGMAVVALLLIMGGSSSWPRPARADGATHYVAPGGNCGSGVSPCYASVQAAVDAASTGDEILVASGVYTDVTFNASSLSTQTVYLDQSLTLRGGYTLANWVAPDPEANPTVLDAGGQGRVIYIAGSASPTVTGFIIQTGNAGSSNNGGGIYIEGGAPLIAGNTIFGNIGFFGGGIYNYTGSPRLEANMIYSNSASAGGGFLSEGGTPTTRNNIFYDNQAHFGGGLANNIASTLTVQNDVFYLNKSVATGPDNGNGGGLINRGALLVNNTIVFSNTADNSGGGVRNDSGSILIDYSDIVSNTASIGDNYSGSDITVTNGISADPLFVDAPGGDFHLQASSPARNAGTTLAEVPDDFDYQARPFGPAYDMGADEYYPDSPCYARLDGFRVYAGVQAAVDDAGAGGLVQVAGYCAETLSINQSLTLRGGYTTTNWVDPRYRTILDAQGAGRVVYITGDTQFTLENLHVTGGQTSGDGAGVYLGVDVDSILQNNVIYDNQAANGHGGGVYNAGGNALLQHNTIYNNTALEGGGVYASGVGQVTLRNSVVASNTATDSGGGIYGSNDHNFSLDYNDFYGNVPNAYSGAVTGLGPHDISVLPGLRDPANDDFHLVVTTSQVINKADPASTLPTDFEGEQRPQGTYADMGADESTFYAEVALSNAPESPYVVTNPDLVKGTFITFSHTITNLSQTGAVTDSFVIDTSNSDGWQVTLNGISSPVIITTGTSLSFQVVVSVPLTASDNMYNQTIITATSQFNAAALDTAWDRIASAGVELVPSYTENVDPGEVVTYTHTLTNTGPVSDTYTVNLVSDRSPAWGDLTVPWPFTVTLNPNESIQITAVVSVPLSAEAGLSERLNLVATSNTYPSVSATVTDTTVANAIYGHRYVSTAGNDTVNNCHDLDNPCATIKRGLEQVTLNSTVFVASGTYYEHDLSILKTIVLQGGWDNIFTNRVLDPSATVIDAQGQGRVLQIGGGVQPTIEYFTIQGGQRVGGGGGVYLEGTAAPTLRYNIIRDNRATNGGGLYNSAGAPVLHNNQIHDNQATNSGGGLYNSTGTLDLESTQIYDNVAGQRGGALASAGGTLSVQNNFIYRNSASDGGAIYISDGSATIQHDSLYNNVASAAGGGIFVAGGATNVFNTIVFSHTGAGIYRSGGTVSHDYNDVYQNSGGDYVGLSAASHSLAADPLLMDADSGDLHLTLDSPVADQGDPASPVETDIDGDDRPVNQGFDIGADEMTGCLAKVVSSGVIYGVLQEAVDAAGSDDEVQVSGYCWGVHPLDVGGQVLSQTVHVTKSITLQGGWDSTFSDLDPQLYITTLDARGMGRVALISGTTATLENFHMVNGDAAVAGGPNVGGGIYLLYASPTVRNNWIYDNRAAQAGGLFNSGGNPIVERNRIFNNEAVMQGGGLYNNDGHLMLRNNFVYSNTAVSGGGLYNAAISTTILHNTFYANQTSNTGAGVYNAGGGAPAIRSNIFANNSASDGGAVYDAGVVLFDYNDVWANGGTNQTWSESLSAPLPSANNISQDPQFLDVGTADFHLNGSSPLVDAGDPGTSLAEANGDFDGDPRPSNQGFDIGADEQAGCYASIPPYGAGYIYGSVQLAVDLASTGDTVRVAGLCQGVHPLVVGPDTLQQTVHVTKDVTLQGGWTWDSNSGTLINYNPSNPATLDALQLGRVLLITDSATVIVENFNIGYGDASGLGGGPGSQAGGGGVYNFDGDVTLRNSNLFSNTAQTGGALYNAGGSLALDSSSLYTNQADNGAAVYLADGSQTVAFTTIYSNLATSDGGAVYIGGGHVITVSANTIWENEATNGAAIFNAASAGATVQNNVVYRNQASFGGGFYNGAGSPLIQHNTFYDNQAITNGGGGLYSAAGSPIISNSLFINNVNVGVYVAGGTPAIAYNDVYGNSGGDYGNLPDQTGSNGNISADPLFLDVDADDFHLLTQSPAMDSGDPTTTLTTDFEGDIRPSSQGFDMGADEVGMCFARINGGPEIYGNPQAAVDASQPGDTIDVAGVCYGVHTLDVGDVISQTLHVTKSVTLNGGWRVELGNPFAEYDPALYTTILDAQSMGRVLYLDGGIGVEPTISGFSLRNGDATLPGLGNGGGIYNNSNATLSNLSVYSNTAVNGGGFYNADGMPTLNADAFGTNHIYDNIADNGAGLYLADGMPNVWNAIVRGNTASYDGGGFYLAAGQATVLNNTIYQNDAGDRGGGIYIAGGSHDVRNLIVVSNSAANDGGGIRVSGGSPSLAYNDVWNNTSGNYGGIGGDRTGSDGNISADPLFADGVFHLSDGSPALDAGDPAATLPGTDFEGTIRPTHQRFDMGADEVGGCLARLASAPTVYYGSVQQAVDLASSDDSVQVAGYCLGVHALDLGGGQTISQTVHLAKSITLEGGWQLDPPFGVKDHVAYPTYLDASDAGRVLYIYDSAAPTIRTINILNGNASGLGGGGSGEDAGGCVYIASGQPDFTGGINIALCQADQGGGIYNLDSDFVMHNTAISGNAAQTGGGFYNAGGSPEMQNLLYEDNLALYDGGAIYVADGSPQLWHLTLAENEAGNDGGAVYNAAGGDPLIRSSIFYANIAGNAGGGFFDNGLDHVDYSDWYNNVATTMVDSNVPTGTGSLSLNPLFDTAPDRFYALLETSPLIDAGAPITPPVALDFELDPRPQINGYDMGWDEVPENVGFSFTPNRTLAADPCDVFTVTHTLSNIGNVTDTYTVTLQSNAPPWDNVLLPDDPLIVSLDGGQSAQIYFRIEVPCDALGGTQNVSVLRATSERSGTSATVTDRTTVNSIHAVEIAPTNYGAAAPGETITYTHVVTNSGNVTDTFGVTLSPDYSLPQVTPDTLLLGPGATATITVSVTIEGWAASGLTDIVDVVVYWLDNPAIQASAANHTSISYTTGIRYVAVDGHDDEDPDKDNVKTNNCTDLVHGACRTIQHAVNQASPGDEIWIGGGIYTDVVTATVGSDEIEQVVFLNKSVTLRGGYNANDWTQPPVPFTHTTTLDGQYARRVIYVPTGYTPTIQYLALSRGLAASSALPNGEFGAGLYNAGSDLTLRAVAVHHNQASQHGGGLYSAGGSLLLQNNTIYRNQASQDGGGLYVADGEARLENNTFNANQAINGGAIYNAASMTVTNNILVNNGVEGGGSGGAIYNSGVIILTYNNITSNYTPEFEGMDDPIGVDGNVALPPDFVDADGDDYHLLPASPMIDAGTSAVATTEDFEGDPRPLAGGYDIGADERMPVRSLLFYADEEITTTAPNTVVITHTLINSGEVTDTITLTYTSTYPWPTTFDQPMPYTIELGAEDSHSVVVTIEVPSDANGLTNVTIITATSSMPSVSASVVDTIFVRSAAWDISKTVTPTPTVQPGDYLTYTVSITNIGDLPTSGTYTITDQLPAHTSFITATPTPVLTSPTVTWVASDPIADGGSSTLTFVVRVTKPLTDGTPIVNEAYRVTGGSTYTDALGATVPVTVEAPAMLSITKTTSDEPVRPGDWLTYTLTVSNDANALGPALGVIVSDTLPANVSYQSMGFVPPSSGVFTDTGDPLLLWQLTNPIPPGDWAQVTATVRVTSPLASSAILTNTFAVTADNVAAEVGGAIGTAVTATNSITLHKTVEPAFVAPGGQVTYTIVLTNSGLGLATVALTDVLHPDFSPPSYITNVVVPGRTWSTTEGVSTVSFTATAPMTVGVYYNQWVTATFDVNQVVAITDTAPVSVEAPMLEVSKQATPDPVQAGTPLTYTIRVTNTGNTDLHAVVTDTLPAHVVPTGAFIWTPTITAPGGVWTQTVVVGVETGYTGTLTNVVEVTTEEGATGTFTATTIVFNPVISVDKRANVDTANVGETITYTYVVTNTGSAPLTDINASDDRLGAISLGTTSLASGETTTGIGTYVVQESDLPGPLTNMVIVTGTDALSFTVVVTDTHNESVALSSNPAIEIVKSPDSQTAVSGAPVTFTITITNTGDVTLSPITVTDVLAPNCNSTIPTLGVMGSTTYTCTDTAGLDDFTNTAVVTGTSPATGDVVVNTDTAFVDVLQTAIEISKTPDSQMVASGGAVTFTVAVTNVGDVTLSPVTVTDVLAPSCNWVGSLDAGDSWSYACAVTNVMTDFINIAEVTGTPPSAPEVTADDSALVIVEEPVTGLSAINNSPTLLGSVTTLTATTTGGTNVVYTWAFGDGTGSGGAVVPHTYPSVGVYTAVVTASNSVSVLTATTLVTITDVPIVGLVATNDSPTPLGSVTTLTATITAGSNVTYTWAFGDGTTGSGALVTHTYPATGTFTAVVTASNSVSLLTATTDVTIIDAPAGSGIYLPIIMRNFTSPLPTPNPDLVVRNIELNRISGNNYAVRVTACNQSSVPVTFGNNFYVNAYFGGDYDTPIIVWGVQGSWFGAGECVVLESDYVFNSSGVLRGWADPFNTVIESDEYNNTLDVDVAISGTGSGVLLQDEQSLLPSGPLPTPTIVP
jgi:uncharacterized repeat protein (TIGR01451 family)